MAGSDTTTLPPGFVSPAAFPFRFPFPFPGVRPLAAAPSGSVTDTDLIPRAIPGRIGSALGGAAAVVSTYSYDVAVNGIPFFSCQSEQEPYQRQTADYRRQQFDAAADAGEQSLINWWLRSQATWHGGAGLRWFEPAGGMTPQSRTRFDDSFNMDSWTIGLLQKQPDCTLAIPSAATGTKLAHGYRGTSDYVLFAAGNTLTALVVAANGTTSMVTVTWGGSGTILSLCCDGQNYFVADNAGIWTGPVDNSAGGTKIYTLSAPTNVVLGWAKSRLMAAVNQSVYQLSNTGAGGPALPATPNYTHPTPGWVWTCFGEEPLSLLAAGYAGGYSGLIRFQLATDGSVPVLTSAIQGGTMPQGERIYSLTLAAGSFLGIGTSRGVRIGVFDQYLGKLQYGALVTRAPFPNPVLAMCNRTDYIYAGATAALPFTAPAESGLVRVAPSTIIDNEGHQAWAPDLVCDVPVTGAVTGIVCTVSNQLAFSVDGHGVLLSGTGPGSARTSWLRTGRIRYTTVEPKLFKYGSVHGGWTGEGRVWVTTPSGELPTPSLDYTGATDPMDFSLVPGPLPWVALRFELVGGGGQLSDWQVKALPATPRQRIIQLVLRCADAEADKHGNKHVQRPGPNRLGWGYQRLRDLEALEAAGDAVTLQQFLPGMPVLTNQVLIDQLTFRETHRATQTEGMEGVITLTCRALA